MTTVSCLWIIFYCFSFSELKGDPTAKALWIVDLASTQYFLSKPMKTLRVLSLKGNTPFCLNYVKRGPVKNPYLSNSVRSITQSPILVAQWWTDGSLAGLKTPNGIFSIEKSELASTWRKDWVDSIEIFYYILVGSVFNTIL